MFKSQHKPFSLSLLFLGLLYWAFLWIRAFQNPLVFDEATSFFSYIQSGNFWPGSAYWSANNHFLNSLLSHLVYRLGGMDEWLLRLPNLLAFPLFYVYAWRFLAHYKNRELVVVGLIALLAAGYPMEFFAYSRGYGLMFAFMMAAAFQLQQLEAQGKLSSSWRFLLFASLGILSNLSWLPLLGFLSLMHLYVLWRKKQVLKTYLLIALNLIPIAFALWMSFELKAHLQLYYGGQNGFLQDSIGSLIQVDFGLIPIFLFQIFTLILAWIKRDQISQPFAWFWALSYWLIPLFYILGHWLIDLNFPFDRGLMYWSFWALISALPLASQIWQKAYLGRAYWILACFIPLWFLIPRISLNHSLARSWSKEQIPDSFYQSLAEQEVQSLSGSYLLAPQWNYLQVKNGAAIPAYQKAENIASQFRLSFMPLRLSPEYDLIAASPSENLVLLQRKENLAWTLSSQGSFPDLSNHQKGEPLFEWPKDSIPQALQLQLNLQGTEALHKLAIAFQSLDKDGKSIAFEAYEARHYLSPKAGWQEWRLFVVLGTVAPETERMKVFIWNPHSETFSLKDAQWRTLRNAN